MTLAINPAACFRDLPENERSYASIPAPHWIAADPLQRSFSRYRELWFGGTVVWGHLIQANAELFSDGSSDLPGEVVYDPSGTLEPAALAGPAARLAALKGTRPSDRSLREFADYLTDEMIRVVGMPVPDSISNTPLLVSTLLFHRKHLPDGRLTLSHFPLLINDRFPGVAMVFPSRWWPDDLLGRWRHRTASASRPGTAISGQPKTKPRTCSNCKQTMRKLGLAAHYQRTVEIDVCESCSLIWFDDTESARLAGPGLADLMHVIHHAMTSPRPMQALPLSLPCPICAEPLKRVANISRFGRSAQLECGFKHGAFQSFALFLAEKGYFRPYSWADIKAALGAGKRLSCFNCGAMLEPRPHDECPYCKSPVGMIDPTRLASAIDSEGAAEPTLLAPKLHQSACPCCGGAIDLTSDLVCPHCMAVVRPVETKGALAASAAVESQVRDNYERQTVAVSRRKLEAAREPELPGFGLLQSASFRNGMFILAMMLVLGTMFFRAGLQKAEVSMANEDGRPLGMDPTIYEGVKSARREKEMATIPHSPAGVVPSEIEVVLHHPDSITVTSRSTQRLGVTVNLNFEYGGRRCKMVNADAASAASAASGASAAATNTARFSKAGESHLFKPGDCDAQVLANGKYEYSVWSLDDDRYLYKSDSAFY